MTHRISREHWVDADSRYRDEFLRKLGGIQTYVEAKAFAIKDMPPVDAPGRGVRTRISSTSSSIYRFRGVQTSTSCGHTALLPIGFVPTVIKTRRGRASKRNSLRATS
jgi:hypothetical protein